MSNKTLYQYIIENIDSEDEIFTKDTLPDNPYPTVKHPLGAEEGFWIVNGHPSNEKDATEIYNLTKTYFLYPDHSRKQKLYKALSEQSMPLIMEALCAKLQEDKIEDNAIALARSFFYNAKHRGPLKFAYLIFGLYGIERLKLLDEELWSDMVTVAKCEEFTYIFIYACGLSNYEPMKAYWRLIGCTSGWGKVFAIEAARCNNEAQELWLIQHGMEINVDFPPLAVRILEISSLTYHLEEKVIDKRTFKGAAKIIYAFLNLVNIHDGHVNNENFEFSLFAPASMLYDFYRHAKIHATLPEDMLPLLNINIALNSMSEDTDIWYLDHNTLHELIAEGDQIIFAKDWSQYLKDNIIKGDIVNFDLCELACRLRVDVWKQIYDYLCYHNYEYKLLPYLFVVDNEEYQKTTLQFVEDNLNVYCMDEKALLVPLNFILFYPGLGEKIIVAALESLYDWPRGIACCVLDTWGREYITTTIRDALYKAYKLSNNDSVTKRISELLFSGNN